jgi:CrcB protein
MDRLAWVSLGGALGSGARYLVSQAALSLLGSSFPYGTLTVNVIGSYLIGLVMHLGIETTLLSPTLRILLTTGVMGGFTTYSTYTYETLQLAVEGDWRLAAVNVLVTLLTCLGAGALGLASGRTLIAG